MHETNSPQSSFDTRATGASAADDALLDLGQVETSATVSAAEADDFILDLDLDDEPAPQYAGASHAAEILDEPAFDAEPVAAAPSWADAPSAFAEAAHGEQPRAFADALEIPSPFGEQSHAEEAHGHTEVADEPWRDVVMQDGPQGFAFGSETQQADAAPRDFVEPEVVPADEPVPAFVVGEYTDGSVEGDVSKAPAPEVTAGAVAPAPQEPSAAGFAVGEARAGLDETPRTESPRADQLSQEMIDAIARRVVEMMSDKVVREIAWEVVPDLAELLIRQRVDEDKKQ